MKKSEHQAETRYASVGHGGKREGSGRKKGEETTTINFRVPKARKEEIKKELRNKLKLILQISK